MSTRPREVRPQARPPSTPSPVSEGLVLTAFLTLVLIGGANFVAVRFSNVELAPFWGAGSRFLLASSHHSWTARSAASGSKLRFPNRLKHIGMEERNFPVRAQATPAGYSVAGER
jgi:hypothetical protein